MVGGAANIHRLVMQRESTKALVLNPIGEASGAKAPR